jgi:N-acetylglucosamine malate deacetylase 1
MTQGCLSTSDAADSKLRIVVFGAHPDDSEYSSGGTAMLWAAGGHHVQLVSMTNGDIGHFAMAGGPLAQRRTAEVKKASEILGTTSLVLDNHDGELMPTLENRCAMTRVIRRWDADVIIGHRPNDYHPDHRYVGALMQDSAFMVGVPFFCPDVPALKKTPMFLYSYDNFQQPAPFRPDVVVAIDSVIDKKMAALLTLESQFIEGGALGKPDPALNTPAGMANKRKAAEESLRKIFASVADQCRDKLIEVYGAAGRQVRYAEAFEICEYGYEDTSRKGLAEDLQRLFPFVPGKRCQEPNRD